MIHLRSRPGPGRHELAEAGTAAARRPGNLPPSPPELPGDPFAPRPAPPQPVRGTMRRPRFIPNPPPETCTTCGCDLDAGSCGWCQPRQAAPSHAATRLAAVVFWHDRRDLPVFRQTVRARGWNGLHLRAAGVRGPW